MLGFTCSTCVSIFMWFIFHDSFLLTCRFKNIYFHMWFDLLLSQLFSRDFETWLTYFHICTLAFIYFTLSKAKCDFYTLRMYDHVIYMTDTFSQDFKHNLFSRNVYTFDLFSHLILHMVHLFSQVIYLCSPVILFTCFHVWFFYTVDLFTRDFTLTYIFTWFFISYLFTCYFYTINLCSHIIVYYFVFTCNFSILCLLSHNFYTLIFFIYFLCSLLFNVISYRWFIFFYVIFTQFIYFRVIIYIFFHRTFLNIIFTWFFYTIHSFFFFLFFKHGLFIFTSEFCYSCKSFSFTSQIRFSHLFFNSMCLYSHVIIFPGVRLFTRQFTFQKW